jgi:2,4-dichlorophenol 6-monooxygenase
MTDLEVPVLIVEGGGAGLTASMLLSQLGVESLLINVRASTSDLPNAHVLNQRAMEILRGWIVPCFRVYPVPLSC